MILGGWSEFLGRLKVIVLLLSVEVSELATLEIDSTENALFDDESQSESQDGRGMFVIVWGQQKDPEAAHLTAAEKHRHNPIMIISVVPIYWLCNETALLLWITASHWQ